MKDISIKNYRQWKTILAYIVLLLSQFLIEYCFFVLSIIFCPKMAVWFGDWTNLHLFLSVSGIINLFLVFEAIREGRRK